MLTLKVRPDPFTGRNTGSYRSTAYMDPETLSGIGKEMGGIYMFAGKEKGGGLHVFLVIFTLKEIEIPPAPSRSVHVPLMHMLALPGYRRDLHTSAMSCTRVYRSTTFRIQTFCT